MTRINCIPVQELCNKHLFAEWRELPRIVNHINTKNGFINMKNIPDSYKLGAGHVKFFYNKVQYLIDRHEKLTEELLHRGYNIIPKTLELNIPTKIQEELLNNWTPNEIDININKQRIKDRMPLNPKYTTIKNIK